MTCIGNSGPLSEPVAEAIEKVSQVTVKVLLTLINFIYQPSRFWNVLRWASSATH